MRVEDRLGALNYKPIPVVWARAQGKALGGAAFATVASRGYPNAAVHASPSHLSPPQELTCGTSMESATLICLQAGRTSSRAVGVHGMHHDRGGHHGVFLLAT